MFLRVSIVCITLLDAYKNAGPDARYYISEQLFLAFCKVLIAFTVFVLKITFSAY